MNPHLNMPNVPTVDYRTLLDPGAVRRSLAGANMVEQDIYGTPRGIRYEVSTGDTLGSIEVAQLDDDVIMMFSETSAEHEFAQRHIVSSEDWIHIQFRLSGESEEAWSRDDAAIARRHSCLVVRHPANSTIVRTLRPASRSRVACLFMRPSSVARLFAEGSDTLQLPSKWIVDSQETGPKWLHLELSPAGISAVNDLFQCNYRGRARHLYLQSKALELSAELLVGLGEASVKTEDGVSLSARDCERVKAANSLITSDLSKNYDLGDVARHVGLNRTKLALGFKAIYGSSMQSYLRHVRLNEARKLLEGEGLSVSEVSHLIGYAEPSCLTRAFRAEFGVQPKALRAVGRARGSRA